MSSLAKSMRASKLIFIKNKSNIDVPCPPTHHFGNLGCKICHFTNNRLNENMVKIDIDSLIEAIFKTIYANSAKR